MMKSEWQPIETALNDSTKILPYSPPKESIFSKDFDGCLSTNAQDMYRDFLHHQERVALTAIHKEQGQWNEYEHFAVCVMGGAEIEFSQGDLCSWGWHLKYPCAVQKVGSGYRIIERKSK